MKTAIKGLEKLQGLATISMVDVPENVHSSNEERERLDVQLTFKYKETTGESQAVSELLKGMDESLLAMCEKASRNNKFTYLLDATRLGYDPDSDTEKEVLAAIKKAFEGKEVVFTTFIYSVREILNGTKFATDGEKEFSSVHNSSRAYSSFNSSYLLVNDNDEQAAESIRDRIIRLLDEGEMEVGRSDEDVARWKKYRKAQKQAAED